MNKYIVHPMNNKKNIALVAHDNRKKDLLLWVTENKEKLIKHNLFGTGTTSKIVSETTGIDVFGYKSGPLGGDQQIGAKIAEGDLDILIFFWDPLEAQPHDPDVKALLRIAVLYNIPVANNISTADFIFSSSLLDSPYDRRVKDYESKIKNRKI